MPLFALDPERADFYTAWGFWVGVFGTVVGVVGFGVTIWQLVITRRAAEAAKAAAEETLAENKEAFERFVAGYAGRLLTELQGAANRVEWRLAELRAQDLADLLAALPATRAAPPDAGIALAVRSLRVFAQKFAVMAAKGTKRLSPKVSAERWQPLLLLLHDRLDRLRRPFPEAHDGEPDLPDPGPEVPGDRPEPPGVDGGGTSQLGASPGPRPNP